MQIDLYPQRPLSFARQTDCHFCVCNPATYHIYAQFLLEVIIRLVRMIRNMVIRTAYVLQIQMVSQM